MENERLRARIQRDLQECNTLQENIHRQESDDVVASVGRRLASALHFGDDSLPNIRDELDSSFGQLASADAYLSTGHADQAYLAMVGAERHIVQAESRYSLFSRETGQRARNHSSTFGVASYSLITLGAGAICPPAGLLLGTAGLVGSLFVEDASGGEPGSGFSPRTTLSTQSAIVERAQMHLATFDHPQDFEGNFTTDFGNFPLDFEIDRAFHLNPQRPTLSREDEAEIRDQFHTILSEMNDVPHAPNESDEEYIIHLSEVIYDLTGLADYDREQPQMTGLLRGDGGNCEAAARLLVSLFTTSGLLPRGWQVTLQYFDGNENDDPHVQVILYNKDRHVFLNPLSGELTHEENNPLFYPETLDISYLLSRGAEPIRNFNDPALIAYRPPTWSAPTGGINSSGSSSGDSSDRNGALANIPRTGVIFRSGHAPERSVRTSPRLHEAGSIPGRNPINSTTQPSNSTLQPSRVFLGNSEALSVIEDIQAGLPYSRERSLEENSTETIIFASARDSRTYNELTNSNARENFLEQVTRRSLNRPRWAHARRVAENILESPQNVVLYSERDIHQATELLQFLNSSSISLHHPTVSSYPNLRNLVTRTQTVEAQITATSDTFLRTLNALPSTARNEYLSFLSTTDEFIGYKCIIQFLIYRALDAQYGAGQTEENRQNTFRLPSNLHGIQLIANGSAVPPRRNNLTLQAETFYALIVKTDLDFNSDLTIENRASHLIARLANLDFRSRPIESRATIDRIFRPYFTNESVLNDFLIRLEGAINIASRHP